MNLSIEDIRINVAARVGHVDGTIIPDIENGAVHDNLVRLLDCFTAPPEKGAGDGSKGYGRHVLITSLEHDHHDDSALGLTAEQVAAGVKNHGHTNGFAVDLGEIDGNIPAHTPAYKTYIKELAQIKYVTKIGTIPELAEDKELVAFCGQHNTVLFSDPGDGPHVHCQTAESV